MSLKRSEGLFVISPHRDDAAFSCGVLLSAALEIMPVTIVNIFTRSNYAPFAGAGVASSVDAVTRLREREDAAMMNLLRAKCTTRAHKLVEVNLDLLDAPLRLQTATEDVMGHPLDSRQYELEVQALTGTLAPLIGTAACVVLPLGLGGRGLEGHIDHQIARAAGRRSVQKGHLAFYQDSPYAARMSPLDRTNAIEDFSKEAGLSPPIVLQRSNARAIKDTLARCYASQVDAETIKEMCDYTDAQGGEWIYASSEARTLLEQI